jgi:hypothetical protein
LKLEEGRGEGQMKAMTQERKTTIQTQKMLTMMVTTMTMRVATMTMRVATLTMRLMSSNKVMNLYLTSTLLPEDLQG